MLVDEVARIETTVVFRTGFEMSKGSNEMCTSVTGVLP